LTAIYIQKFKISSVNL